MIRLRDLLEHTDQRSVKTLWGTAWIAARPELGPLVWRFRDAWAVLTGRADAFTWPDPSDRSSWCSVVDDSVITVDSDASTEAGAA
ncbi:hypothetical protein LCGC14_2672510 [marine sediment metagenome]|uniref:Uncharacterized protein n=1 Tax=marine sediment metagenome TaxID=412755 RepID=A0A0F9CFN2_9ZZZZ